MNRREKYLENVQMASIERKVRIVKAMETQGYLNEKYKGVSLRIQDIVETLTEVYEDSWDIIFSKNIMNGFWVRKNPFDIEFVIHFPEINITNKDNLSHIIRDLYVKLVPSNSDSFSERGFTFRTIHGKRMSATREEVFSQYQHSHLSGRQYRYNNGDDAFTFRAFCLGSSEITQALTMVKSSFNKNSFKLLLLQLEEYVNWESIEGNPYMYISKVLGGGVAQTISHSGSEAYYEELLSRRADGRTERKEVDFKFDKGVIRIKDNDKFEEFLKTGQTIPEYNPYHINERDALGKYFGYRDLNSINFQSLCITEEDLPKIEFIFRGQLVSFKLIEEGEQQGEQKPFFINKSIKDYVKTRIEQKANNIRFKSYIINKLNSPAYSTKDSGQDRISVSEN